MYVQEYFKYDVNSTQQAIVSENYDIQLSDMFGNDCLWSNKYVWIVLEVIKCFYL